VRIDIVTIFPDYFGSASPGGRIGESGPLGVSLIGKAGARGDIDFRVHDLRAWTTDVHHTVDDTPFGGGPGMVMKPDVWGDALDALLADALLADAVLPETGLAGTELADAVLHETVLPETGLAETGLPETGLADTGPGAAPASGKPARLIVPTPSGTPFTQELAAAYAREPHLLFACGRYEGIDSRVVADARTRMPVDEVSIGDYVLAG